MIVYGPELRVDAVAISLTLRITAGDIAIVVAIRHDEIANALIVSVTWRIDLSLGSKKSADRQNQCKYKFSHNYMILLGINMYYRMHSLPKIAPWDFLARWVCRPRVAEYNLNWFVLAIDFLE